MPTLISNKFYNSVISSYSFNTYETVANEPIRFIITTGVNTFILSQFQEFGFVSKSVYIISKYLSSSYIIDADIHKFTGVMFEIGFFNLIRKAPSMGSGVMIYAVGLEIICNLYDSYASEQTEKQIETPQDNITLSEFELYNKLLGTFQDNNTSIW